jgi:hypothetical protein
MTLRLFLIPAIFAATAAVADTERFHPSKPADAHARAAALLSRPQTKIALQIDEHRHSSTAPSEATDAHARAAALLSGQRPERQVRAAVAVVSRSSARVPADAQAQAAALLSGSRMSANSSSPAQRTPRDTPARGGVSKKSSL